MDGCDVSKVYGVATSSRLLKIIGLLCKRAPLNRSYSAKETYNFKEPTNCRHPIATYGTYVYTYCGMCIGAYHFRFTSVCAGVRVLVPACRCAGLHQKLNHIYIYFFFTDCTSCMYLYCHRCMSLCASAMVRVTG